MELKIKNPNNLKLIDYREVKPLQGDLKDLPRDNYIKLKNSIIDNGFFVPLYVWYDPEGVPYSLDGHQRLKFLNEEECTPHQLPYLEIEADNLQEAKKKLLVVSSQYGRVNEEGFQAFTQDLDAEWISHNVSFDVIDIDLSNNLNQDLLDEDEDSEVLPPQDAPARISDNGYSNFELIMEHQNKLELVRVVNVVKDGLDTNKTEDALMYIIRYYAETKNI